MALHKDIRIYQYLIGKSHIPPNLSVAYTNSSSILSGVRLVNMEKSELDPKQVFDFIGYQFDLKEGKVTPTLECWQILTAKIQDLMSRPTCPVRQLMSLIGLLRATKEQVHLGQLNLKPIQWHLKNNRREPESLEKVIPIPRSLHPHLKWCFKLNHYTH